MKISLFLILLITASQAEILSDTALLRSHVFKLVNTDKPREYANPDILDSIASYIRNEFVHYGFTKITEQKYLVKNKEYKNIIAVVGPENSETIVIGAHYDVCGPFPGADDNASGIAGLLECARLTMQNQSQLTHRIEFVAYTLEEPPFFGTRFMGSYLHATYLHDYNVKVKLMICFDMIGYFSDKENSQEYPLGFLKLFHGSRGDYIACISDIRSSGIGRKFNNILKKSIKSKFILLPEFIPGIDFSDHRNFWRFKMPAVFITDTAFNRNHAYHTASDTIENLNFSKIADIVKGTVTFVVQL